MIGNNNNDKNDNNDNDNNNKNDNFNNPNQPNNSEKIFPENNFQIYSNGSFGIILKDLHANEYVYKITELTDFDIICQNNFSEMLYLNYFKNKYNELYNQQSNSFLPIQNESTQICSAYDFYKKFKISHNVFSDILDILDIKKNDYIIVNKMKYYPHNLLTWVKIKNDNNIYETIEQIENLILGLHLIHSNNIAHGDLKSSNIVTDGKQTRIIDFGGVKSKLNQNYICTCTSTYRAPEDLEYEINKKDTDTDTDTDIDIDTDPNYKNCPIKSDIWSLGIILFEILLKKNPILDEYKNLVKLSKYKNEFQIEKKLYEFIKKKRCIKISESDKKIFAKLDLQSYLTINQITTQIEKILVTKTYERIGLNEIYLEIFYVELPDFEKLRYTFNYNIEFKDLEERFREFRKNYYWKIKKILMLSNQIHIYPLILNLFDRFIITNLKKSINNKSIDYDFFVNILDFGKENFNEEYLNLLGLITCTCYIISKILITNKLKNIKDVILKFRDLFSVYFYSYYNINQIVVLNLIYVIETLGWDVIRPKLFLYPDTLEIKLNNIVKIIEDYDIINMIKEIE